MPYLCGSKRLVGCDKLAAESGCGGGERLVEQGL